MKTKKKRMNYPTFVGCLSFIRKESKLASFCITPLCLTKVKEEKTYNKKINKYLEILSNKY